MLQIKNGAPWRRPLACAAALLGLGFVLMLFSYQFDGWLGRRFFGSPWQGAPWRMGKVLLQAAVALPFAWLLFEKPPSAWLRPPSRTLIQGAGTLALGLGLALVVYRGATLVIGASRHWVLLDDTVISLVYSRNLAEGLGLAFNGAQRSEGFSNFIFVCLNAIPHLLKLSPSAVFVLVIVETALFSLAMFREFLKIQDHFGLSPQARLAGSILFGSSTMLLVLVSYGEAMVWQSFLVFWCLRLLLQSPSKPPAAAYVAMALMPLMRVDGFVHAGLLILAALVLGVPWRRAAGLAVAAALATLGYLAFRRAYFGEWLSVPTHLKMTLWPGRLESGFQYTFAFAWRHLIPLSLAFAWCWRRGREGAALALLMLGILAQSVAIGGDFFKMYRFLLPVSIVTQLLAFSGAEGLKGRRAWVGWGALFAGGSLLDYESILAGRYELAWGMAWHFWNWTPALLGLFLVPLLSADQDPPSLRRLYRVMVFLVFSTVFWRLGELPRPDADLITVCGFLEGRTEPGAKVATDTIGLVRYLSRRPVIDLLGKTDARIAKGPAREGGFVGHNKFDFDYSYGELRPDYVLQWSREETDLIVKNPRLLGQAPPGSYPGYHAASCLHPYFVSRCHPHPVFVTPSWAAYRCQEPGP